MTSTSPPTLKEVETKLKGYYTAARLARLRQIDYKTSFNSIKSKLTPEEEKEFLQMETKFETEYQKLPTVQSFLQRQEQINKKPVLPSPNRTTSSSKVERIQPNLNNLLTRTPNTTQVVSGGCEHKKERRVNKNLLFSPTKYTFFIK